MSRTVLPSLLGIAALGLTAACSSASSDDDGAGSSGGAITVAASDKACDVSRTDLTAGANVFSISNKGSQTTEVYVYGEGDRIVAEKENIGPGLKYELTVHVPAGTYTVACKPGMVGDGIRTAINVSAGSTSAADPLTTAAVTQYRAYVTSEVATMVPLVAAFADAVKAGDVAKAKELYAGSRQPWEAIEPVAESFGDIDPAVDLREADLEAGQTWTGWHTIEKQLWVDGNLTGMGPVADGLAADIADLQSRIPTAEMTATSIGNGAKELLDEVATGKITGEEEAFSHTDLDDFAANIAGAQKAYDVLRPIVLTSQPDLVVQLDKAFGDVAAALVPYATATGYVTYDTVTEEQRRALSQVVDALGEPLSQLAAAATR